MKLYVSAAKTVNIVKGKFAGNTATLLTPAQYDAQKDYLDYQFKQDNYRFYSKPGKEQYTWKWYAVPYGDRLEVK